MNKYKNIDIVDVDFEDDIVDEFIADVEDSERQNVSVAIIGNKDLAGFVLDSLTYIKYTPLINKVYWGSEGLYIVYVSHDYELYVQPLSDFKYKSLIDKVYIDADSEIKQTVIDHLLDNKTKIVLFSVTNGDEKVENTLDVDCSGSCKHCVLNDNTEISLEKDEDKIHGFSASKTTDNGYRSYSYYSSDELATNDIIELLNSFGF